MSAPDPSLDPSTRREPARRVDPELLFGISLLAGLALSASSLSGALHGDVDITVAGLRLLVAIAFSWAASYGITAMFTSFSARADELARAEHGNDNLQRRASDAPEGALTVGNATTPNVVLPPTATAALTSPPAALGSGNRAEAA